MHARRSAFGFAMLLLCLVVFASLTMFLPAFAADDDAFAMPAEFERLLMPPGEGNHFLRPNGLRFDRHHDELMVVDPGHNRVVIFDPRGTYRFEITGGERFSMPYDVAVDSEGFIHILASSVEGVRIFRFDFDGLDLGAMDLPYDDPDRPLHPRSMVFDDDDLLYVADEQAQAVRVFDAAGVERTGWSVGGNATDEVGPVMGRITYGRDALYVPMPVQGTVHVYDLDGRRLRTIGHKGNNTSEFNFPVAVDLRDDGTVMVLDKHRFAVLCFTQDGRFIGEFGGKGVRPGWFYHPSLLLDLGKHGVLIGQVFQNWVQVCRVPDVIETRAARPSSES